MRKYQLYKLINQLDELKDKRHPMFEKNKFMKFLVWFMILYYGAILLFLGAILPIGMSKAYYGVAAFHVFDGYFLWIIICDFWVRFILQETPAQQVRPFRLLPVSKKFLMHTYLSKSGLTAGNMFWGLMLIPFGIQAVRPLLGWDGLTLWLLIWWMMLIANGYTYLFTRALCMKHILWILLPAAIHGSIIATMTIPDKNPLDMPCTHWMYEAALCNPLPFVIVAALIALWYWANYRLQLSMLNDEVANVEEVKVKPSSQMTWLNRWGSLGEYMKMEIKLRTRNKQVRMQFLVGLGCMLMLSGLQYFTDIYDTWFMTSFICLYDYIVLGMMTLIVIMCYEGNYIDCLMSRRESIYELLRAKYYFNTILLIIPIIILLPLMISGKVSVWMNLGYLMLTAGVLYPLIFQMAVYNNSTLPLNQKLMGKQGNTTQQIVSLCILFLPIGLEKTCTIIAGPVWGYIILMALGLTGILTHKLWLHNIYTRMMSRRYTNMEGFHASRSQ